MRGQVDENLLVICAHYTQMDVKYFDGLVLAVHDYLKILLHNILYLLVFIRHSHQTLLTALYSEYRNVLQKNIISKCACIFG